MLLHTHLRACFTGLILLSFMVLSAQKPVYLPSSNLTNESPKSDAEGLDCGSSSAHEQLMKRDPDYAKKHKLLEEAYYKYAKDWVYDNKNPLVTTPTSPLANTRIVTIPVVVHVMHLSGTAIGTAENISDAQVQAGIQHLNDAFAKRAPYNAGPTHSNAGVSSADIEIQFCLATIDPSGNPTSGITRHATTYSNIFSDDIVTAMPLTTQDDALKAIAYWNSTQYMNFYIVNEIKICSSTAAAGYPAPQTCPVDQGIGVAGYAYFASSHGQPNDGVVNEAAYFGTTTNNSKVHIHEVGHYFNLDHTFNNGCSNGANNDCYSSGDNVCDTPPDNSTASVNCSLNATANTCSNDATLLNSPFTSDVQDLYEDYMDYGFQSCQNTFTPGQKLRMRQAMFTTRKSLLTSGKCAGAITSWVDAALVNITSPVSGIACASTFTPQITVSNNGNTVITAMVITATLGGTTLTNNWTGTLALGASTNISFASMTLTGTTAQNFVIQITSVNGQGIDTNESNNNLSFLVGPSINQTPPTAACAIAATNTNTSLDFGIGIFNVTINTINVTSSSTYTDGRIYDNRICSNYTTFSSPNTSSSVTTSISVQVGPSNQERVKVFIDLNNDGTFQAGELLLNVAGKGVLTNNITIPSTVTRNTLLRLRVVSDFNGGQTIDACITPTYSQVEDYGVIISTPSVLSVDLLSFTVINKDDKNLLNWQTTTETNNSHFIVQKSKDGQNFEDIATVKGHGTTTTPQYYEFVDARLYNGGNYYRLQQCDGDGKMDYSKIVSVNVLSDKQQKVRIYPNPTHNILTVEHLLTTETLEVVNALGQVIKTIPVKPETLQTNIPTSDLDNGIYFLRIHTTNGFDKALKTIRFVKL